jgi:hypothetical protein
MPRPQPIHTRHHVELGLDVEAVLYPVTRPRLSEPGDEASLEDVGVTGVFYEKHTFAPSIDGSGWLRKLTQKTNLLSGCDTTSPDLRRFLSNLTEALRDDLVDALFEEASRDD